MTFLGRLFFAFDLVHWTQVLSLAIGLTSLALLTAAANSGVNLSAVVKATPLALAFGIGVTFVVFYPLRFIRVWLESRRENKSIYRFVNSSAYIELLNGHLRSTDSKSDR
jgi:hypothetical protein